MCCLWHLTRSQDHVFDRWVCDTDLHPHSFTQRLKKKKEPVRERKRAGGGEGWVKCWNMNYKPEQHHLDRENTHHSGEPAHWIRLATGSICTSWNQSHSLIWLGQPHRRKRKLLCSLIKLVFLCTPLHKPTFGMLCIPMSFGPTGRVMTVVEVNAKKISLYLTLSVCATAPVAKLIYTFSRLSLFIV